MLKNSRFFLSATLISALFITTLILSKPVSVRACPEPPPETLLSLYLKSDLIFVADIRSEEDAKVITDETDYSMIEISRNLRVFSVLKGKTKSDFVYTTTEYRSKNEQDESYENYEDNEPYGYKGYSKLTVGERYLFFFTKNEEAEIEQYELTDGISGVRKLNDYDLSVHKKRLRELKSIVNKKENQLSALTDWLIRLIEEPATRWDGVMDLSHSFEALEYGYDDEEETGEQKPFAIDADFSAYTSDIARNVTDAQKAHISSILFRTLQQTAFEENADEIADNFTHLVKRWDKMRLAMYAFNVLQTVDKADAAKTKRVMSFISTVIGDDQLYEISESYPVEDEAEETAEETEPTENVDSSPTVETKTEEVVVIDKNLPVTENQTEVKENQESPVEAKEAQENEFVITENPQVQAETTEEAQPKELTRAEIRAKLLQDFTNRYEYLLVRGFQLEEGAEKPNAADEH